MRDKDKKKKKGTHTRERGEEKLNFLEDPNPNIWITALSAKEERARSPRRANGPAQTGLGLKKKDRKEKLSTEWEKRVGQTSPQLCLWDTGLERGSILVTWSISSARRAF